MKISNPPTCLKQSVLPVSFGEPNQDKTTDKKRLLTSICTRVYNEQIKIMKTHKKTPGKGIENILAEFYPYTNLKLTIRKRKKTLHIRISDILIDAPEPILVSAANCIISSQLRIDCPKEHKNRYREFIYCPDIRKRTKMIRQERAKKRITNSNGKFHDLEKSFVEMNMKYFNGEINKPIITWSQHRSKYRLGHYDPDLNTIMVSKKLDSRKTPRILIDYIIFHELLHARYPGKYLNGRWCVHTSEFKKAESRFDELPFVKRLIKNGK
jgi:predicted metal-dependent hydrolase